MNRHLAILSLGAAVLVCTSAVLAVERFVPSEYATIQAAIDDCNDGDVVIVEPNTYTGPGNRDIDFLGKAITVRSSNPEDPAVVAATVIDCEASGRGFHFYSGETSSSVVAGLTITNGYALYGAGIFCEGSSPTISKCIFSANTAEMGSGGIENLNCSAVVANCIFTGNMSGGSGGGIENFNSPATVRSCVFWGNLAGTGGGVQNVSSSAAIINCTFSDNYADQGGAINNYESSGSTVTNCILWGDSAYEAPEIYGDCSASYCDVEGSYPGTGNIAADPCFVDPAGGDYHLSAGSPCIESGDPAYSAAPGETDIDGEPRLMGTGVDMGADEFTAGLMPVIEASPTEFEFSANEGGPNPASQILSIRNSGLGTLNWEITEDCTWLSA
ncbi:MAG: choice-of-anchor Q domain-containing protein, partial [Planctomycetota bacterium]